MPLPDGFLQEVILRNPLEDVVRQYADLKRAGSNLVCCCPFHSEKTPSFTVYTHPNPHYYCYGCQAGGDVITFVRQIENLDYLSAVEYLANRAGLAMPQSNFPEKRVDKKRFYEINAEAARFWHRCLLSPEGKKGMDYLTGRGLTLPVIKRFGLGYAPDSFQALTPYLLEKGFRKEEIKEAFLGGISEKTGKLFDYFRNRAVFPVIDVAGNVVAFSGRFVGEPGPNDRKYFNTNDTPVYKKSQHLFALNVAKNSPDKEFVLCEGNMDAVSLHAAGISNAIASLGTALTGEQCRLLARYTDRVVLCYDGDAAGKKATDKAITALTGVGIRVRVLRLPDKGPDGKSIKDPDDFVRAYGRGGFLKYLEKAPGSVEYRFSEVLARNEVETMDGKSAFIRDGARLLAEVASPVERELYLHKIAEITGLSDEVIRAQTDRTAKRAAREETKKTIRQEMERSRGFGDRINTDKVRFSPQAAKEEAILGILLLRPDSVSDPKIRALAASAHFRCEFCRRALEAILALTENGEPLRSEALNERFSPEEMGELEQLRRRREALGNNSPAVLRELFERLEEDEKSKELRETPLSADWIEKLKQEKIKKESRS